MSREFTRIGVVGLGTMGAGIAEVFARHGYDVVGLEQGDDQLTRGREHIQHSTDRAVKRGKLDAVGQRTVFDRLTFSTDITDLADCQLVVEAVVEQLHVKRAVFSQLDAVVGQDAILATNTSSLSVTEISAATAQPDRVVGMHFFNPAPVQAFVEVIRTVVTAPDVISDVTALATKLGKNPVVAGDKAGFIANALLFGYLNHAATMFESRYATREDIDASMRLGCGYPMGPLALLDLIGLDTAYEILETMYRQGRDRLHAPAPVLKQMVTAGMHGRKTGRGFYTYEGPDSPVVVGDARSPVPAAAPTMHRAVDTIGVVGTGTMATGIVSVFAAAGFDVTFVGRSQQKVDDVIAAITRRLDTQIQRGGAEQVAKAELLGHLSGTTSIEDLGQVDLVIEAVSEQLDVKQAVFATLDEICKPGAILTTTTSSLPVIECASVTSRPGDVIGMHFFNPATRMNLVEVVSTVATTPAVSDTVRALCTVIGRHPVSCGDRAGFIVNALLFPYLNDAVRMLQAHYASADDIDIAMRAGCALPMGPFELLDVIGNDVSLAIQRTLFAEFREPGFAPAPLLEHLVTAGYLGRKTGRGFRDYAAG
jgi:3-hydroxybutyryl-CoA dehydrogenase